MSEEKIDYLYLYFVKHAATKSEARRVYNIVKDIDFEQVSMATLLDLPGIGRASLRLIAEVVSDIRGK